MSRVWPNIIARMLNCLCSCFLLSFLARLVRPLIVRTKVFSESGLHHHHRKERLGWCKRWCFTSFYYGPFFFLPRNQGSCVWLLMIKTFMIRWGGRRTNYDIHAVSDVRREATSWVISCLYFPPLFLLGNCNWKFCSSSCMTLYTCSSCQEETQTLSKRRRNPRKKIIRWSK